MLFVCRANVCRSAVAEFVASERSSESGLHIASAGTDAVPGQEICPQAEALVAEQPKGRDFARAHRSTRLTPTLTSGSALIVTATPRERSAVARMDPAARPRTFTMVELDRLLSVLASTSGPIDLATLVAQLHGIRWQAASEHWNPPTRFDLEALKPRRAVHGLSLVDAHVSRSSNHAAVVKASRSLTFTITDHVLARIEARGTGSRDRRDQDPPGSPRTRHAG
ncbi:protein-tyrosine-phosphatase [Aeromicrobium flavum]|uniref:Protein-tyrosine-phosphatase n=2 Tax=Aeromicrobium flavum TaxID=416568 RepID=A0A512HWH8_9ACTN|nr:protein-tyrosine-phosphatase [Aeromicrobium flavum]